MADFTFGDHREDRETGNNAGGENSGEPGSGSGTGSDENRVNGTANGTGSVEGQTADAPYGFTNKGLPRKRRAGGGRKPGSGNTAAGSTASAATNKGATDGLAVKNDREKVKANIAGLHAMAAVLTKQPILNLKETEATALTNALCDVADHHAFNLIGAGGAFALYATLATTAYMIYMPRVNYIKQMKASDNARPVTPGEAREEATTKAGKMDFSSDTAH